MSKGKIIDIFSALLISFGLGAGILLYFLNFLPIAVQIPDVNIYSPINKNDYLVTTDGIENAQNDTVVYQSTAAELEEYGKELRYVTGKTEPLSNSTDSVRSDVPSDIIHN